MTPFDSIGGLLGQFGNPEQDKNDALKMSLMALGMGLLGARKGQQWRQAGNAGMNALNVYQGSLANAERKRKSKMEEYSFATDLLNKQRANEAAQQDQQALSGIFGNTVDLTRMGRGGPTEANAQAIRVSPADNYRKAAAYYAQRGNVEAATKYSNIADKLDEEYSTTPQVVRGADGKLQLAQFGKRGGTKVAEGLTPAEKLHFGSTGGMTNVGFDPYSGEAVSAGMPATMDPAQIDASKRGWASQGLEREKFAYQKSKDAQGGAVKPQLVNGQWVYPPDAANPTGRAVTPTGISNEGKPLTESQAKAAAFANQMANASQTIAELDSAGFNGKTGGQQAAIVAAGAEGIPWVPGSAAIPRAAAGKDAQRFYQAELQWTEGALRFMTGANAPKEEVIRNAATYFPRPGDSPAVIAQKAAARRNMEQSVRLAAGGGNAQLPAMPPAAPVASGGWSIQEVK